MAQEQYFEIADRNIEEEESASPFKADELLSEYRGFFFENKHRERPWSEIDSVIVDLKVDIDINKAIKEGKDRTQDLREIEWSSFVKHMKSRPNGFKAEFGPWDQKYVERRDQIWGEGYKADRYKRYYENISAH